MIYCNVAIREELVALVVKSSKAWMVMRLDRLENLVQDLLLIEAELMDGLLATADLLELSVTKPLLATPASISGV
jgi:hypothetical protein